MRRSKAFFVQCVCLMALLSGCQCSDQNKENADSNGKLLAKDTSGSLTLVAYLVSGELAKGNHCKIKIVLKNESKTDNIALYQPVLVPRNIFKQGSPQEIDGWLVGYEQTLLTKPKTPSPESPFAGAVMCLDKKSVVDVFQSSGNYMQLPYADSMQGENICFISASTSVDKLCDVDLEKNSVGIDLGVFNVKGWWPANTPDVIHKKKEDGDYKLWFGSLYLRISLADIESSAQSPTKPAPADPKAPPPAPSSK